jgi:hypothetical protein
VCEWYFTKRFNLILKRPNIVDLRACLKRLKSNFGIIIHKQNNCRPHSMSIPRARTQKDLSQTHPNFDPTKDLYRQSLLSPLLHPSYLPLPVLVLETEILRLLSPRLLVCSSPLMDFRNLTSLACRNHLACRHRSRILGIEGEAHSAVGILVQVVAPVYCPGNWC